MPSLRELLAAHAPLLLIDAASARVQVGWLASETTMRWETSDEEAGIGVFRCLAKLAVDVNAAAAFAFCEGPGSILGIRTTAMALRTWNVITPRPLFSYQSLAVAGAYEWAEKSGRNFAMIADARRDSWHCLEIDSACRMQKMQRVKSSDLPQAELCLPEHFRTWSPLPANVRRCSYTLAEIVPRILDGDFFRPADAPDAFLHEEPSYATWSPQIHRAP